MDNGAFLLVLLLPFSLGLFLAAVALLHGASAGINSLVMTMRGRIIAARASRRAHAYVRKHQRDTSHHGLI
ncbi:hypothetical protein ACTJKH_00490 [Microbacterium sp. 22215]|uniref:hypothetical protein n=1 Tax=Microbacterium sp. 22215 TaxID=3453893 RepID=UPI003F8666B8